MSVTYHAEGGQAHFRIWIISVVPLMGVREARIFTASIFYTILLKNNFNPKAVSQLMRYTKEIITIDVYGDTAEIIEDCLDDLQPFIDEVIPKEESESGTDFSEDNYIEQISEFLA